MKIQVWIFNITVEALLNYQYTAVRTSTGCRSQFMVSKLINKAPPARARDRDPCDIDIISAVVLNAGLDLGLQICWQLCVDRDCTCLSVRQSRLYMFAIGIHVQYP